VGNACLNLIQRLKRIASVNWFDEGNLSSWQWLYPSLAIFNVLTIALGLSLSSRLSSILSESVAAATRWDQHTIDLHRLAELAGAIDAPGNDIFRSLHPEKESARIDAALIEFNAALNRTVTSYAGSPSALIYPEFHRELGQMKPHSEKIADLARLAIRLFQEGKTTEAANAMSVMDQALASFKSEIHRINRSMSDHKLQALHIEASTAQRISTLEWITALILVPVLSGITLLGARMGKTVRKSAIEREQLISELIKMRSQLETRVNNRTAQLASSEKQYRELVAALPGAVFQLRVHPDGSRSFPFISEGIAALTGVDAASIHENPSRLFELIEARDMSALSACLNQDQGWHQTFPIISQAGDRRWVRGQATPWKDQEGVRYWHGVLIDVSEQKDAEQKLVAWGAELEERIRARTTELEISNRRLEVEVRHRVRMQEKLMQVTLFQRTILDAAGYAIIATDENGTIRTFNAAAEQMLGYSVEEVVGTMTPLSIHDPEEIEQRATTLSIELGEKIASGFQSFTAKARLGIPDEREWTYIRKDGARFPVLLSIAALSNGAGGITGFVGIAQDITERKRIENEIHQLNEQLEQRVLQRTTELSSTNDALRRSEKDLQESLSLLNATLESTADGILVVDENGRVDNFNRQFLRLWRIPETQLPKSSEQELFAPFASELVAPTAFLDTISSAARTPEAESFDIVEFKDGRVFERHSKPRQLKSEIAGRVWSFRDITDRRKAEAHIEEVNRQLMDASRQAGMAEIATSVLHNVGNVLNSINVSVTLIADNLRNSKALNLSKAAEMLLSHQHDLPSFLTSDPKGRQLPGYLALLGTRLQEENSGVRDELSSLVQNIDHIKQIVAMQQSYAKVSGVKEALQLGKMLDDALRMSMGSNEQSQIEVVREFEEIPTIYADKHKTLQIFINLIRNAKYALHENDISHPKLTLRLLRAPGDIARVEVSDNGIGIAPQNMQKLFRHGFTTKRNGHGFGPHGSAHSIREMGGNLRAQSDGLGTGATFIVEFPIAPPRENAHSE